MFPNPSKCPECGQVSHFASCTRVQRRGELAVDADGHPDPTGDPPFDPVTGSVPRRPMTPEEEVMLERFIKSEALLHDEIMQTMADQADPFEALAADEALAAQEGSAPGHRRHRPSPWGPGSKRRKMEEIALMVRDQELNREEIRRSITRQAGWWFDFGWRDRAGLDTPSLLEPVPPCVLATDAAYNRVLDLIGARPLDVVGRHGRGHDGATAARRPTRPRRMGHRRRSKLRAGDGRPGWGGIIAHSEAVRRAAEVLLERFLEEVRELGVDSGRARCARFLMVLCAHRRWHRRDVVARGDLVVRILQNVAQARADGRITRSINAWWAVPEHQEEHRAQVREMTRFIASQKWFQDSAWEDDEAPG